LGVILFESLTGRRPMEFETLGAMYTAFLQGTIPSLSNVAPDIPHDVSQVIDACLRRDRDARMPDLRPLIEVLRRYTDARVSGALSGGRVVSVVPRPSAITGKAAVEPGAPTALAEGATHSPLSSSSSKTASIASRRATILALAAVVAALAGGAFLWTRHSPGQSNATQPSAATAASVRTPDPVEVHAQPSASLSPITESVAPTADAAASASAASAARPPRNPRPSPNATATPSPQPTRATPTEAPAHGISPQLPY
jgi:serine/threonine-protein kinase